MEVFMSAIILKKKRKLSDIFRLLPTYFRNDTFLLN